MDQAASVLLDFPPEGGIAGDAQYHAAAQSHSQKLDQLAAAPNFPGFAPQLLDVGALCAPPFLPRKPADSSSQHVHPAVNSNSYLTLLIAARAADRLPQADLLTKVATFLSTFDARQIRYRGKAFSALLRPRLR
jgi:COP9 signalosome complex subunit 3